MARNPPFMLPTRHKHSRSGASSRTSSSRRTAGLATSTQRFTSTCTAPRSGRAHLRPNRGQSLDSTAVSATPDAASHAVDLADGDDDTLNEIIMSVDLSPRGTVGCCYYVAREEKLYFMEDVQFGDVEVIEARKYVVACIMVVRLTILRCACSSIPPSSLCRRRLTT